MSDQPRATLSDKDDGLPVSNTADSKNVPPERHDPSADPSPVTKYRVGDRIRFVEERLSYTVQAVSPSGRYLACTKPCRIFGPTAVMYTMVDLVAGVRGVDNTIGNSLGYETRADCLRAVLLFESGEFEFSRRSRPIPLNIRRIGEAQPVRVAP